MISKAQPQMLDRFTTALRVTAIIQLVGGILLHLLAFFSVSETIDALSTPLLGSTIIVCAPLAIYMYLYSANVYSRMPTDWKERFNAATTGMDARSAANYRIKSLIPQRTRDIYFVVSAYCLLSSIAWIAYASLTAPPKYLADHRPQYQREPMDPQEQRRRSPYMNRVITNISIVTSVTSLILIAIVYPKLRQLQDFQADYEEKSP